jgi:crotonobetainyl-CoA:carnitine CoA-transferase CaiB-like acyl-CoA transferase
MPGPLSGIRVVDFSAVISGPLATMLLADQGADVVKVEAPDRVDLLRKEWYYRGGLTSMFANVNRGKRSVLLDLQSEQGLEAARALCARGDVVLENFRPGVAERLGIGPDDLHATNPRLVYCRISGYGQSGPWSGRRSYDPVVQGLSGFAAIQKNPEVPIPDLVRNALVDKAASYTAAQAVTAALLARERGEEGQTIEVSLLDAGLAFLWPDGMMKHTFQGEGVREGPALYDRYRLTETADGHVVMWAGMDNEWHAVYRGLGRPDLIEDERFATGRARAQHGEELGAIIYAEFKKHTTAEIVARMEQADAPCGPLRPSIRRPARCSSAARRRASRVRRSSVAPWRRCWASTRTRCSPRPATDPSRSQPCARPAPSADRWRWPRRRELECRQVFGRVLDLRELEAELGLGPEAVDQGFSATILQFRSAILAFSASVQACPPL